MTLRRKDQIEIEIDQLYKKLIKDFLLSDLSISSGKKIIIFFNFWLLIAETSCPWSRMWYQEAFEIDYK